MGGTRTDPSAWAGYQRSTQHKTAASYTASQGKNDMLPVNFKFRESTASDANPRPTPIIIGLDVTGSMGHYAEACRKQLGTLFIEILKREPVSDPHVMACAIGDFRTDRYPIQSTQFEADPVTIGKQIEELYLEGNGGGNYSEGYLGPLYLAGMRTKCDSAQQGRKGIIVTMGDEGPQEVFTKEQIREFFGDDVERDYTAEELIALVQRDWHYYHLLIEEGSHMQSRGREVTEDWRKLLNENAIPVSDHTKISEIIISLLELIAGKDKDAVIGSWSGDTSLVVAKAVSGLPTKAGDAPADAPVAL